MRKLFVTLETGYCGSTEHELVEVDEDTSDEYLSDMCWEMAVEHAESYGFEMCDCDDPECEMEHEGNTNISGFYVNYVPEKHDMYL